MPGGLPATTLRRAAMIAAGRFEQVAVASIAELRDWLMAHHGRGDSVWLVTWKKAEPTRYIPRDAVLDALIAFGWVDGLMRKLDDTRVMQLISPRRQQRWAKSYKDRAARLITDRRMHAAGLAAIERSKAAGLWEAMDAVDALVVPADLNDRLATENMGPRWEALPPSYRRNVLRWITAARTAPTRAKRVEAAAISTREGRRLPQM